jgi:hypothetical protein
MKKILIALATGSLVIAAGCNNGVAQDEEKASQPVVPVEIYACTYNEGRYGAGRSRCRHSQVECLGR